MQLTEKTKNKKMKKSEEFSIIDLKFIESNIF
jgi:hypothetical protein